MCLDWLVVSSCCNHVRSSPDVCCWSNQAHFHPLSLVLDTELSLDGEKSCTQCSYTTHSDIVLKAHVTAKHPLAGATALSCPLCSDKLTSADLLEKHLFTTHNVNEEGVKKLMSTVDMPSARRKTTREEGMYAISLTYEI